MSEKKYIDQALHDRLWFHRPFEDTGCSIVGVLSYDGDENEETAQRIVDYLEKTKWEEPNRFHDTDVDWKARSNETCLRVSSDVDGIHMRWDVYINCFDSIDFTEPWEWFDWLPEWYIEEFGDVGISDAEMYVTGDRYIGDDGGMERAKTERMGPNWHVWSSMPFYQCLLAHLQANVANMRTPYDATRCVDAFCASFVERYYKVKRQLLRQDAHRMLAQAKRQAAKTSTGIPQLDSMLCGGYQRGGIYVVAGDPAAGKTALAVQSAMFSANQCEEDECVAYFMLDQGGCSEVIKRGVSLAHAIAAGMNDGSPSEGLELSRCHAWSKSETDEGIREYDALTDGKLIVKEECSVDEIRQELGKLIGARLMPRMIVIDYYQLLVVDGEAVGNSAEVASEAMSRLRAWSYENGACILLCGQYSKQAIERHQRGERAQQTDLLGGVDVPYQAEAVLCLTKATDGSGNITIEEKAGILETYRSE